MACKINFTEAQDAIIRERREAGFSYDAIAKVCGISHRQQIIDRCKVLGVTGPVRQDLVEDDAERAPLAAGSPASWGAINAGLSIAGAAYPHPVG